MPPFGWTQLQLFDEERRLRLLAERQMRAYTTLLEEVAKKLAPALVDARRRMDPTFFQRLTIDGWQAFFLAIQNESTALPNWQGETTDAKSLAQLKGEIAELTAQNELLSGQLSARATDIAKAETAPDAEDDERETNEQLASRLSKPTLLLQLPASPPADVPVSFRNWEREGLALAIVAKSGWSLRYAIAHELSLHVGISANAGSLKRMFAQLEKMALWQMQTVDLGRSRAVIVQLTDLGRSVMQAIEIGPVESEWKRLHTHHGGDRQLAHTALVCTFTHQARLRDCQTEVCPELEGHASPDVLLAQGDERLYIEVEAESGDSERRMRKWRNQAEMQGAVALCAPTPEMRQRMVLEAKAAAKRGYATDINSLLRGSELWIEEW